MLFKNYEEIINNGETEELKNIRKNILDILESAVDAVDPYRCVKQHFLDKQIYLDTTSFSLKDFNNIYLVGFGKASIGMAQAVCDSINVSKGVVVTNDAEKRVDSSVVSTYVGSHPIPDEKSIEAADKVLEIIEKCEENDLLIVLISGGGSALLCKPRVNIKDMQVTTGLLLRSGADINEINTIRKHLSFVKGGQLIKNCKSQVVSLIISDIIGDPMGFISSGPTFFDSTSYDDSFRIFEKYDLWEKIPGSVKEVIKKGLNGSIPETLKKDNPVFKNVFNFIVANNDLACNAAMLKADELGYETMVLTTSLSGEAKDTGSFIANKALKYFTKAKRFCFISGGETTVTIHGDGKGGRNQEMVLGTVDLLDEKDIVFASFATDGIDGMSDAAGAIVDCFSFKKAEDVGLSSSVFLENNDSYCFFKKLGDVFFTGSTGTNVMDIQIIVKIN